MYRVIVCSFATQAEAEVKLRELKTVKGLESSWLLSNE